MKTSFSITIIIGAFFLTNCTDNNATTNEKQQANNSSTEKKTEPAANSTAQGDDITGEWELVGFITDTNDNLQLDDDERKNLTTPSYKDSMKLNRDGGGLFTVAQMERRYEIKKDESNGMNAMTW